MTNVILLYRTEMKVMQIKGQFLCDNVYIKVENLMVWIKQSDFLGLSYILTVIL